MDLMALFICLWKQTVYVMVKNGLTDDGINEKT